MKVEGDRLEVVLQVSALASVAVAMPHASDRWQLDEVSVERAARSRSRATTTRRCGCRSPRARIPCVSRAGSLPPNPLQLAFPQPPRVIDVSARGWTTSGVNEGRLVSGSLELARERDPEHSSTTLEAGAEFPAFVRVDRVFNLDLDWTVDTVVTRIAPQRAALSVEIPLVAGESVLTDGVKVRNNEAALVGLGAGESQMQWHSGLARAETLEVSLPADAARTEVWSFVVNPQWNVAFEGFAPVLPEDVNAPAGCSVSCRAGRKLKLKVTRPKGVKGTTLAIDSVSQVTAVGTRSSTTTLRVQLSQHAGWPSHHQAAGGRARDFGELRRAAAAVAPGEGRAAAVAGARRAQLPDRLGRIPRRQPADATVAGRPADPRPATSRRHVQLPDSRWILAAWGPGMGPRCSTGASSWCSSRVAWLLGRWAKSPLRFVEWLLLGLGLSTQSWFVFSLTAAWLMTMRWREHWQPAATFARWRFNAIQVVLAAFTFATILTLVFSGIRNGLLAQPDMHIAGTGGPYGGYSWFQDQTDGVIEGPSIFSVPMWVYRALFFAWATWMAFALVGWLRWAFNAWKTNGLWRGVAE